MTTEQTPDKMKAFVRRHFEDFVNNKNAAVIHQNMTPDFLRPRRPRRQADRDTAGTRR